MGKKEYVVKGKYAKKDNYIGFNYFRSFFIL